MQELQERAAVLAEALPYIRQYAGKTVVIKYGGAAMESEDLKRCFARDVVLLHFTRFHPVVVHGGGPKINEMMDRLGLEPVFAGGLRVTDAKTMEVAEMVLAGTIQAEIVSLLSREGIEAVGLSGKDATLIHATKRTEGDADLGFVGDVEEVHVGILELLARHGYVPVLSSIGVGPDGESYNINADHAAGAVAGALKCEKLIMLTDVRGVLRDPKDPDSLISVLTVSEARDMIRAGAAGSGMIPKLEACCDAVEAGVPRAHIIDGRIPHAILMEIFTDEGIGTMIVAGKETKGQ
jgi:acetylglutamate kinase